MRGRKRHRKKAARKAMAAGLVQLGFDLKYEIVGVVLYQHDGRKRFEVVRSDGKRHSVEAAIHRLMRPGPSAPSGAVLYRKEEFLKGTSETLDPMPALILDSKVVFECIPA